MRGVMSYWKVSDGSAWVSEFFPYRVDTEDSVSTVLLVVRLERFSGFVD